MPQEAISLFPRIRAMVDQATAQSLGVVPASPVEQAEEAAGKVARRGRGQGFQLDQEVKVAVEACAMNKATDFYSAQGWTVDDVHGTES
jgi:Domain of unknown function (DUF3883)